jgi:CRP-like cAMP-binding protein
MNKQSYLPKALEAISTVSYFQQLDGPSQKAVAASALRREYEPGQLVLLEGEPASGLYVVQSGWLKVTKFALDGREQTLHFLGPGDAFNAVSVFTGSVNPATVTALEKSVLLIVTRDVMLRLLDAHPTMAQIVIRDLAGRVLHLIGLVEDLSLRTVEARLVRMLLEQAEGSTVKRQRWATQGEMAARLGTVPDVVNRVLRKLAEEGLVRVSRSQIELLDREALEAKAKTEP